MAKMSTKKEKRKKILQKLNLKKKKKKKSSLCWKLLPYAKITCFAHKYIKYNIIYLNKNIIYPSNNKTPPFRPHHRL